MTLYHSIACTKAKCDPPRTVQLVQAKPRGGVRVITAHLPGCTIGDPTIPGGVIDSLDEAAGIDEGLADLANGREVDGPAFLAKLRGRADA